MWSKGREGGCAPPRKFFITYSRKSAFCGYLMHSDVLILKLWFSVHRMLQGCATISSQFFSDRLQFMGKGFSPYP